MRHYPPKGDFVMALDKTTGKTVWRTNRSIDFQDLDKDGKPYPDPPAPQRIDPKDDTVESFIEAVFSVPPRRE